MRRFCALTRIMGLRIMNCKGDDFEIFFLLESNNERIGLLRMGFEEWEVLRKKIIVTRR